MQCIIDNIRPHPWGQKASDGRAASPVYQPLGGRSLMVATRGSCLVAGGEPSAQHICVSFSHGSLPGCRQLDRTQLEPFTRLWLIFSLRCILRVHRSFPWIPHSKTSALQLSQSTLASLNTHYAKDQPQAQEKTKVKNIRLPSQLAMQSGGLPTLDVEA